MAPAFQRGKKQQKRCSYGRDWVDDARRCKLASKLPSSPHGGPATLAAVRGFLVSASPSHLAVHNTTPSARRSGRRPRTSPKRAILGISTSRPAASPRSAA